MFVIIDSKVPEQAKKKLSQFALPLVFSSENIVQEYLSGHPDIFFTIVNNILVVSPNTPNKFLSQLKKEKINFQKGNTPVSSSLKNVIKYNAIINDKYLIHKISETDSKIVSLCTNKILINTKQGFSRCSCVPLGKKGFITSDYDIALRLKNNKLDYLLVDSTDIKLHGINHGLFGGCCGFVENTLFIVGSLNEFTDGRLVKGFCESRQIKIVELYNGPLLDVGSLLFVNQSL